MMKDELIRYVSERYSTEAEYPWDDENFIFRHSGNRKWFAVAMRVPYRRLGIDREGSADIADVKCGPLLMDSYRSQPGILPGYHMNKDHWITILLDGSAEDALIRELLEISYDMTAGAKKRRRAGEERGMELLRCGGKAVRVTTADGRSFEGVAEIVPADCGLRAFGLGEESIRLGRTFLIKSRIERIEALDPGRLCGFFGAEHVPEAVRELYRDLRHVWCAETCAPRMRASWTAEDPTLGQCSVTAFLAQDLFGGEVLGVPLGDGNHHCFNVVGEETFDLTSEQFGEDGLDYAHAVRQSRETHFAKAEKLARYELLRRRLFEYRKSLPGGEKEGSG